jgi:hypothetical protein
MIKHALTQAIRFLDNIRAKPISITLETNAYYAFLKELVDEPQRVKVSATPSNVVEVIYMGVVIKKGDK